MIKHSDNLENKEKVKYDLYKILRMSVLLGQNEVDEITRNKFKEASLNIDKMLGKVYDEKLETMFYDTTTLEEEERRLKDLVALISDRIEKRKELLEDYRTVTSRELTGIEYIDKSSDLDLYEERLATIKEYLDSSKLIEVNEEEIEQLKEQLVKEYDLKSEQEIKNTRIEEELYNAYVNSLYEMDIYNELDLDNIEKILENLQTELKETKEQKDTFVTAFENLKSSGITGELEIEYASYVENSKKNYYYVKEKEIILKLYKLIEEKESEYYNLYNKREEVKELLQERTLLRNELGIKDKDYLLPISNLIFDQKQEIESEKENVDNINVLTERIKLKENRLEELNKKIRKPEILSILKEYSLIDTYDQEELLEEDMEGITLEESEINTEDTIDLLKELLEEESEDDEGETEKTYQPNEIKESVSIPTMNFGLSRLKSISVMKRVGDMLGINAKKEEIKEIPKVEKTLEVVETKEEIKPETKQDDLFWTPVEFVEMKKETEDKKVSQSENNVPEFTIPEKPFIEEQPKLEEVKIEEKDIFATPSNEIIFPEPIMPSIEAKPLPETKQDDKFMWPENMEVFDLNGLFPN